MTQAHGDGDSARGAAAEPRSEGARLACVTQVPLSTPGGLQKVAAWLNDVARGMGHRVEEISRPLDRWQRGDLRFALWGEACQTWKIGREVRRRGDFDAYLVHSPAGRCPGPGLTIFHLNLFQYAREAYPRWNPNHWKLRMVNQNIDRLTGQGGRLGVALSRHQASCLRSAGFEIDHVIYNPIDAEVFRPVGDREGLRLELGWPAEAFIVLSAARPDRGKRWARTMRLAGEFPEIRFYFAGLSKLPASAPQNCRALGLLPPARMPRLFQAADLFLTLSVAESFQITVLEAMASGLALLATPTGLAADLQQEGGPLASGILNAIHADPAPSFRRLLDSPALRQEAAEQGRAFAIEHASMNKIAAAYRELLRSVL